MIDIDRDITTPLCEIAKESANNAIPATQDAYAAHGLTGPLLMPVQPVEQKCIHVAPVVFGDPAAIAGIIKTLLTRAGLSQAECARRMGLKQQSLSQYTQLRRSRGKKQQKGVSMRWFARLVETCGGKVVVELPESR